MIELGRRTGTDEECQLCTYCSRCGLDCVENEFHFLLVCKAFTDLRNQYFHPRYHNYPSLTSNVNLMNSESYHTLSNLAKYIFFAF